MYAIKWEKENLKPRERLLSCGAEQLSNQELLAICLRTGTKGESVNHIAQNILNKMNSLSDFRMLSLQELQKIKGIGKVKSIEIKAMLELARRIEKANQTHKEQILTSKDLAQKMMLELKDKQQEHVIAFYLDTQNKIIEKRTLFIGTVRSAIVEAREILHYACKNMATALILVHNHPSGAVVPSEKDQFFTQKLSRSCIDMGIIFLDHLIIGQSDYYSFREKSEGFNLKNS